MKNLIYILIFLPSLLFSQETKNMEFVEIKNLKFEKSESSSFDKHEFFIDSNLVYKIVSLTTSYIDADHFINGEMIHCGQREATYRPLPLWIKTGTHELTVGGDYNNASSLTLYIHVFKLTTP